MEQDPLFAFRIIADIALKALSPAINDPTTGVLALDQLNRLLRIVGRRRLRSETIVDRTGAPRVIFRTPNWEDFVYVSCTEIRAYGAGNVQIARRLRAMLENLMATLPARRHAALDAERRRLDLAIASLYSIPEDRELAGIPDAQGLGGSCVVATVVQVLTERFNAGRDEGASRACLAHGLLQVRCEPRLDDVSDPAGRPRRLDELGVVVNGEEHDRRRSIPRRGDARRRRGRTSPASRCRAR